MRYVLICSGVAGLLSSPAGSAFAQQMVDQGAFRHHQGPGMMGDGWGFNDPTAYLDALKQYLAISSRQEVAWNQYADAVKDASAQMADAHRVMFQAMGTATWQERRDMMNRMFDTPRRKGCSQCLTRRNVPRRRHRCRALAAAATAWWAAAAQGSVARNLSAAARATPPPSSQTRFRDGRRGPPRPRTRPLRCRHAGIPPPGLPSPRRSCAVRCGR